MKKLSIALALILCLVLVVFAFASCGKKKNTTPGTTAAPASTEPASAEPTTAAQTEHVHTPATTYTIDTPETCGTAGSKSYHCTECGEIVPGTEVVIPADPSRHVVTGWTVTAEASVLGEGSREGTCTLCNQKVEESIAFEAKKYASNDAGFDWKIRKNLVEVLDGDHFYPTEGNEDGKDLYFEVDFLWNESITTKWIDGDGMRIELVNGDGRDNLLLLSPKNDVWKSSDAKVSGGFDYGWIAKHAIVYGRKGADGVGTNAENFPNIGAYGWHRVGVQVHEEAEIKDDGVTYKLKTTLYIDGAKAWQISFVEDGDKNFSKWLEKGIMLYTATNVEGVLEYADPSAELNLDWSAYHTAEMEDLYLAWDAPKVTLVDPDFEPDVIPVATPAEATFTFAEGVEFDGKVWFKKDDGAACTEHVWDGIYEVTKVSTLLEDGTRVDHCAICNEAHETAYDFRPDVQKFTKDTTDSYSPNKAKLGTIRGDQHFYDEGNDLLVEYSVWWNETVLDLRGDKQPYIDTRFTPKESGTSKNKNIVYWTPVADNGMSDCPFAGTFEYGGVALNEPDNPYPKFTNKGGATFGTEFDEFPNIGGANGGDGTPQGDPRYGWHRVQIRYREVITNKAELLAADTAGVKATYKLEVWAYVDGVLVIHVYGDDLLDNDNTDRKLYSATSDGEGGITYVENDDLWLHGTFLKTKQMVDGKTGYFAFAEYSAKLGSEFEQTVVQLNDPTLKQLNVNGTNVTSTVWYAAAP